MSFKELCDVMPSVGSVEYVIFKHHEELAWCTWDDFEEVVKDMKGSIKNKLNIRVVSEEWWIQYFDCGDTYYNGWKIHRIPHRPDLNLKPESGDLQKMRFSAR